MEYYDGDNRIYVTNDVDIEVGEITYVPSGEHLLIIEHTGVDPAYRGQGIAQELVRLVVEIAIMQGKKVIPLCPFANAEFKKHPEYQKIEAK
ncbi:GNAT family N-acetyltransferase [Isobaculum melis]|uniref:Uncharacterized protein n=1 Tax=Isobaculum melis TaxID=142588 RepID=A0A1H9TIZ9_9LACT|nr:GNAT family N-acetyltransferase [Isobaculum melis]SER97141.1 hypothetical protein SAMN04488559_1142 [Isobaculum melis]